MNPVNCGDIRIELISTNHQSLANRQPIVFTDATIVLPSSVQLVEELSPLRFVAVQFETAITQSMFLQSTINHV